MAVATPFLTGVRVLDLSIWRPGPYATSLLVPLGADVLKVEPPGGDPMRHYTGLFGTVNAGKRSVVLDLKDAVDRDHCLSLAAAADVVVEGFRPGVMSRLGLDYGSVQVRNPGVVYCSISGYGQDDERAALPGHDVNYQAWAGSLTPEGGPGAMPALPSADLAAGLTAAFGICAALFGRATSGTGTYLDVSMTDVMSTWTGPTGADAVEPSHREPVPGYGLFDTADGGQVSLGVVNEQHFWSRLCAELGLNDEADLDFEERSRRGGELQKTLTGAIGTRKRDELVAALVAANVPVAPVLNRISMVADRPFPPFPIRITVPASPPVPTLDQHRGQGFADRT
jgi:crotonobetainyl-CoA:carnitine CoA-transferase CaiB-like acyl-CoA transferase